MFTSFPSCVLKVKEPSQVQECDIEAAKFKIHKSAEKFRENFFKGQEISRMERKERIKKYGHLNLQSETPTTQAVEKTPSVEQTAPNEDVQIHG